jgi:hypothetical protein
MAREVKLRRASKSMAKNRTVLHTQRLGATVYYDEACLTKRQSNVTAQGMLVKPARNGTSFVVIFMAGELTEFCATRGISHPRHKPESISTEG